jgi:hypothetical protein
MSAREGATGAAVRQADSIFRTSSPGARGNGAVPTKTRAHETSIRSPPQSPCLLFDRALLRSSYNQPPTPEATGMHGLRILGCRSVAMRHGSSQFNWAASCFADCGTGQERGRWTLVGVKPIMPLRLRAAKKLECSRMPFRLVGITINLTLSSSLRSPSEHTQRNTPRLSVPHNPS